MKRNVFLIVILVSCAHAMVHIYEQSLPSVEQRISSTFELDKEKAKETSGALGTVWRIPFGVGALLVGLFADRLGSKPMLIIFLFGCALTSLIAWWAPSIGILFITMFAMGSFASIYHPVGLAIISRETTAETRSAALGWHGIFGSIGIAAAPFIAGAMITDDGFTWRDYYLALVLPGLILALLLWRVLKENRANLLQKKSTHLQKENTVQRKNLGDQKLILGPYLLTVSIGGTLGFVYGTLLHFLTRYLQASGITFGDITAAERAPYFSAMVLIFGAVGQGIAGRIAAPGRLRLMYATIIFGNVPCLIWMAHAQGTERLVAACTMALVHFMNQPVYNSIISHYVPLQRRSLGYGFSSLFCFGMGGIGTLIGGKIPGDQNFFYTLACVAFLGGLLATVLYYWPAAKWSNDRQ